MAEATRTVYSNSGPTTEVTAVRPLPPLLVKISPDVTADDLSDIAAVCLAVPVDGIIVSNTTVARPASLRHEHKTEAGGLSGAPLFEPSTAVLSQLYALTKGRIPLIGVGGVSSGADAYKKIRAGASLVQLYSSFSLQGPTLVPQVTHDLAACLRRDGFASVGAAVGADVKL
jgi:dihydroorotate dehydrogenase